MLAAGWIVGVADADVALVILGSGDTAIDDKINFLKVNLRLSKKIRDTKNVLFDAFILIKKWYLGCYMLLTDCVVDCPQVRYNEQK